MIWVLVALFLLSRNGRSPITGVGGTNPVTPDTTGMTTDAVTGETVVVSQPLQTTVVDHGSPWLHTSGGLATQIDPMDESFVPMPAVGNISPGTTFQSPPTQTFGGIQPQFLGPPVDDSIPPGVHEDPRPPIALLGPPEEALTAPGFYVKPIEDPMPMQTVADPRGGTPVPTWYEANADGTWTRHNFAESWLGGTVISAAQYRMEVATPKQAATTDLGSMANQEGAVNPYTGRMTSDNV